MSIIINYDSLMRDQISQNHKEKKKKHKNKTFSGHFSRDQKFCNFVHEIKMCFLLFSQDQNAHFTGQKNICLFYLK